MNAQINQLSKLDFEKNINNKLQCINYISVVSPTKSYDPGTQFQVSIDGNFYCYVEVIQSKRMYLDEILTAGYNYLDAGLEEKEYLEYLRTKYYDKKWWQKNRDKEKSETALMVVWFRKIIQLKLFDNNDHLISRL